MCEFKGNLDAAVGLQSLALWEEEEESTNYEKCGHNFINLRAQYSKLNA